jgi:hypothetical protein
VRAVDEDQIKEAGKLAIASCIHDQWADACRKECRRCEEEESRKNYLEGVSFGGVDY